MKKGLQSHAGCPIHDAFVDISVSLVIITYSHSEVMKTRNSQNNRVLAYESVYTG